MTDTHLKIQIRIVTDLTFWEALKLRLAGATFLQRFFGKRIKPDVVWWDAKWPEDSEK